MRLTHIAALFVLGGCSALDPKVNTESDSRPSIPWKKYTLDNGAEHRELVTDSQKVYHYATIITKKGTERRVTIHKFFWKGVLALTLQEHENMEDIYMGNSSTTNPEAGVQTYTWDYNKDGVIDAVTIGPSKDGKEYFFGRYKDGVFGHAPTDGTLTALWKHLSQTSSEQGGADQPATRPESKSEGKDKPQPESKVRPQ
jgi:hypothetical protein